MPKYMQDGNGRIYEVIAEHPDGLSVWLERADGQLITRKIAEMAVVNRKPDEGEIWKNPAGQEVIILGKNVDGGFYTIPRVTDGVPASGVLPVTTYIRADLSPTKKLRLG